MLRIEIVSAIGGACLHAFPTLFIFPQAENEQTVAIIALNGCVADRAGELNYLFEAAVSNFQLVMRDAVAAKTVTTQAAYAQQLSIDCDFDIIRSHSGEIYLDYPPLTRPIYIGRGIPQPARRPAMPRVVTTTTAEEPFE